MNRNWLPKKLIRVVACLWLIAFVICTIPQSAQALCIEPICAELSSADAGKGAALIAYQRNAKAAAQSTVQAKLNERLSVKDFGATGNGVTDDTAAINAAIEAAQGRTLIFDSGVYLTSSGLTLPSVANMDIVFENKAKLLAGANGITIFKSAGSWYRTKIENAHIEGNGYKHIIAFDLTRFVVGSALIRPTIINTETGILFRSLNFGTTVDQPDMVNVANPIVFMDGNSNVQIRNPNIDSFGAIGIEIRTGTTYANVGVEVLGGYIQGGGIGIQDASISTKVHGTYFERCSVADVSLVAGSQYFSGENTNHTANIGGVAYKGRNADAAYIKHPYVGSGARSLGIFDFDSSNSNCVSDYLRGASSQNNMAGITTGIASSVPKMMSGAITPIVVGSSGSGIGIYTTQTGFYTKIGNVLFFNFAVSWSSHTGQGALVVTGLPFTGMALSNGLIPLSVQSQGISFKGSLTATVLDDKSIGIRNYISNGNMGLVTLPPTGSLNISGSIVLN